MDKHQMAETVYGTDDANMVMSEKVKVVKIKKTSSVNQRKKINMTRKKTAHHELALLGGVSAMVRELGGSAL